MITYWVMFFVPALAALQRIRVSAGVWFLIGLMVTLLVGLRYRVGGDWGSYQNQLPLHGRRAWSELIESGREPAYRTLNWIAYNIDSDVWLVNSVCAALFAAGLISFVRRLPEPFLALAVAIPYLVIVVAMGYTRQAAAIGLILYGFKYLQKDKILLFILFIFVGALFHRTAIIFIGLAIAPYVQGKLYTAIFLMPLGMGLGVLLLAEEQEQLINTYIDSSYATSSAGGLIRVLLSACFALIFVFFRNHFALGKIEKLFWVWASLISIALVPVATSFPTAADRLGVFLLPLQMFVAAYMPGLFTKGAGSVIRVLVIVFFASLMATWLFFADNRDSWLPYTFWPLA